MTVLVAGLWDTIRGHFDFDLAVKAREMLQLAAENKQMKQTLKQRRKRARRRARRKRG